MTQRFLKGFAAIAFVLLALVSGARGQGAGARGETVLDDVTTRTDLYPANADAKKEIDEALQKAVTENKRVILIFGGNWCKDCHVLDAALHSGEAAKVVNENYELVHVDIGEGDKNLDLVKKYKIPLEKGVPALVVLKSDGAMVYWSGYGEFENARAMLKKDLVAFLNHWKNPK